MTRLALGRTALLLVLLGAAGATAFGSYQALGARPRPSAAWLQAVALARQADRTKAVVPAVRARDEAVAKLSALARSGPLAARSKASMLAGLLQVENAAEEPGQRVTLLADAASALQKAVRLDRTNDDAAYDLELLLTKAARTGRPIAPARIRQNSSGASKKGRGGGMPAGGGY